MKLKRMFWSRWQLSYLNTLQSRTKWMQGQKDLTVGSLVLIKNPASFSTRWTPGRIVATHHGADGICRVVTIQTSSEVMTRPVSKVAVLPLPLSTTSSRPRRMLRKVDSFHRPEMAPRTGTFFILEAFVIGGKNAVRFVFRYRTLNCNKTTMYYSIDMNFFYSKDNLVELHYKYDFWHMTDTAGSDVVQSGRLIFDDFFQHLWPYIGNNTANVALQMVKRLWLIRIDQ
ncbi:adhesion G protein-coupled receptor B2 [Trichonephila clavipes]|nr:adhesion G protein-coupled receptor B2 [Trichonephila clavipes]